MTERDVRFHSTRGVALAGVLRLPEPAGPDEPVGAVLLCQGLSGVKHLVLPEVADLLARDHGLASLRFDYAGFGDSDGERHWIDPRARVDDALHATAWLAAQAEVDATRLGVYGHSYGGPVAISVAARDRRLRALVAVSGPGDGEDMLRAVRPAWDWVAFRRAVDEDRTTVATTGSSRLVEVSDIFPFSPAFLAAYEALKAQGGSSALQQGGDDANRFWLASVDAMLDFHPEDAARRLGGCAALLINGADDDAAPVETVDPVYANIPGPKRWELLPGLGHNDLDAGPGLARAVATAGRWFTDHLT